jgi:manganese transport protein
MFTSDPGKMGEFVNPLWVKVVGYSVCTLIAVLNVYLLFNTPFIGPWGVGLIAAVMASFSLWVKYGYKEPRQWQHPSSG